MAQNKLFIAELRELDREGLLPRGTLAAVS
jgi:hypothetical protein